MTRLEIIKTVLDLHNFFCVQSTKMNLWDMSDKTFNMTLLSTKPDRFYLVEKLETNNTDYNNKTFSPKVEVRYHLRSKERQAYGSGHSYFHDGYISSIGFSYEDLNNLDGYKENLIKEFEKTLKQRAEQNV